MSDVVAELEKGLLHVADGSACICEVHESVLTKAIAEIKKLRAEIAAIRQLSGCVEVPLKSFADIKKETKHGSST